MRYTKSYRFLAGGALIAMYAAAIALGLIERKPATIEGP